MSKFRSKINFLSILNGDKEGYNLGIDGSLFIRQQATRETFQTPRIGTQGSSFSGATPSTDISAGTNNKLNVAVDGESPVLVTLTVAGKTTGALIATELETKINAALLASGSDKRVWVAYDTLYRIYSQYTGVASKVVVTNALTDNVAVDLKLGLLNAGTEALGTDDQDFLLYTEGGAKYAQPIESSPHRSERFHVSFIPKKITADFDITSLINMDGLAGNSLDAAVRTLLKGACGSETVVTNTAINYSQTSDVLYFSLVKVSTIFAEYYTGCYVKDFTLTQAGDAPGTYKFAGMAKKASTAGIGKVFGAVNASASVILDSSVYPHVERFSVGSRVMLVGADGRTITKGYDGSIYVVSVDLALNTIVLSEAVDAVDQSLVVFWHPGAVQVTAKNNIYSDLYGSFKFSPTEPAVCITNMTLTLANDHIDKMNCFGSDSNEGAIAGNRATWTLSVTFDLSNDQLGKLIQAEKFAGFQPEIIIGEQGTTRYLKITAPRWIPSIPAKDIPANGTTPITMEGILYESEGGAKDCVTLSYL